jgi:hypothetical protein
VGATESLGSLDLGAGRYVGLGFAGVLGDFVAAPQPGGSGGRRHHPAFTERHWA